MYIFFEENSDKIPERYKLLSLSETYTFNINELKKLNTLETYYNILNIIGMRLRNNQSASLTLTGTNRNINDERNNLALSLDRAMAIKNYLVNVWNIQPNRIKTVARNLPKSPTISDEFGADDENRRVEISSDFEGINQPVMTNDTLRKLANPAIRFYPKIISELNVDTWQLNATQNGMVLFQRNGKSAPPQYFEWTINDSLLQNRIKPGLIKYSFKVKNILGQSYQTPDQFVPVEQLTIPRKRLERIEDKEFEQYSLILFDYGKAKLDNTHLQMVNFIKSRLNQSSEVYIYGYTDAIGNEEVNRRLSLTRAKEVAKALKIDKAVIDGLGESKILYDNKFPESRFYCRTVTIDIITTINENEK